MPRARPPSLGRHIGAGLRSHDTQAVFAAADEVDAALVRTAAPIVARALGGSVSAARELRGVLWPRALDAVAQRLEVEEAAAAPACSVALESHLLLLPTLPGALAAPGPALLRWAAVGIRQFALGDPVAYGVDGELDRGRALPFERAVLAVALDEADPVTKAETVLGVTRRDIGRWAGATGTAVTNWSQGVNTPRPAAAERLSAIGDLAVLADEHVVTERIPAWFAHRPIPALDGRTLKEALDTGWDPVVVADFVRFGFGHEPVTVPVRQFAVLAGSEEMASLRDPSHARDPSGEDGAGRPARSDPAPLAPRP